MSVHHSSTSALAAASPPPPRNRAWFGSGPIFQTADVLGTMSTAKELPTGLDAMAYDLAFAMGANRRHRMYRTLKTVKDHRPAVSADELKGLVVVISAYVAFRHAMPRLLQQSSPAVELLAYQSCKN
jgi:hypothetical protein